jgi:hypothetical protein
MCMPVASEQPSPDLLVTVSLMSRIPGEEDNVLSTSNYHSKMMKDLPELHRQLAALTNAHIHHDLRGLAEVERRTAMADIVKQIEEMQAFERMPWQAALEKALRRVDNEYSRDGHSSHNMKI